jgi:hypothetical protein
MTDKTTFNQKLLRGGPDASRGGFLEKSPPGRRRQRANRLLLLFLLLCGLVIPQVGCSDSTGVDIQCQPEALSVFQGEKVLLTFEVTNHLLESIRPGTNHFISYHLYDDRGKLIAYDNPRFKLPRVLRRKSTSRFELVLFFGYSIPGDYIVEFDIVKEGEFWGSTKNWKTGKIKLHLKPLISPGFKKEHLDFFCSTGNPLLDQEQYLLRLTLKNSEIITDDGKMFGFSAGSDYPQVWVRDTATFIAYAKLYYPLETLAESIELFMEHQSANGEVVDWVDVSGKTEKMTVETDQESSLVLAAYAIGKENPQWFQKAINGKTVPDRLELALVWVWQNKRNPRYNLIYSGFTADWGDTENTYPDQRATKLSDRSTLVFSIYTQAKYIQAIDHLVKIFKQSNDTTNREKIREWQARSNTLKSQTQKHLYLEDKGYFITHIVPTAEKEKYFQIEKDMLAVGGNAEAIIAGLMNKDQIKRFLEVLEERRKEYQLRTVSFTLIPPYPEGFFPHHLLWHPWNYQNGGEWDWIGGRVVKALFLKGFSKEAERYLLEIVKKNLANFCIFEWEDRKGTGRGAMFYVGAAGVIGEAILMGYVVK